MAEALARSNDPRSALELAREVAHFLDSKRADDVVVLDVQEFLPITSYFVIASGNSSRALQALADGSKQILKGSRFERVGIDGTREGHWICMDFVEVVVHLFHKEAREFYDLDHLWGDATRVPFDRADPEASEGAE